MEKLKLARRQIRNDVGIRTFEAIAKHPMTPRLVGRVATETANIQGNYIDRPKNILRPALEQGNELNGLSSGSPEETFGVSEQHHVRADVKQT